VDNFVGAAGASQPFVNPGDLKTFLTDPATQKGILRPERTGCT